MMEKIFITIMGLMILCQPAFADTKAKRISVDASGFSGNLSPSDTDVQKALESVDNISITGEANTASNEGVGGVGIFKQKAGVNLELKNINAGSNKVSIANDAGNDEVDIDVIESNLTITESQISDLNHTVDTTLTQEQVQDFVGSMVTGNTESLISVTYDDVGDEFDFTVESDLSLFSWVSVDGTDLKVGSITQGYDADLDDLADGSLTNSKVGVVDGNQYSNFGDLNDDTIDELFDAIDTNWPVSVGETNTASNQGVGGVGVFHSKSGVDLQFKNVNAGSNKVTVTNDAGNKEVDVDVNESNLTLSNLGGSVTDAQVPNNITIDNAATADALSSNPSDCSSNQFANTIAANGDLSCSPLADADVPDSITVSNYLPLSGGSMTGQIVADNLGVEFDDSDTNPSCVAGNFNIFADLSELKLKKCEDGSVTDLDTTGGTPSFATLSGGTNTTSAMVVGTGASLDTSGSGTITATSLSTNGSNCTNLGEFPKGIDASGNAETCTGIDIGHLTDVVLTSAQSGQILVINASLTAFENRTVSGDATISSTGVMEVSEADALSADPVDCGSNQYASAIAANGDLSCSAISDADVPDTITASNYLPLSGGTLTGQVISDNLGFEFEESDTNPSCAAGNFNIFADLSENKMKKCQNGTVSDLDTDTDTTANETITLSGDASGSGTSSIAVTIQDDSVQLDDLDVTGTADSTSYLRGDGTWSAPPSASTTAQGVVELATISETSIGTDSTRAISPDGLSGSIYGRKTVYIKIVADDGDLATGDGQAYWTVPADFDGMNLLDADVAVYTASSSGTPTFQFHNLTDTVDMLSTLATIDVSEFSSFTAATQPVINTSNDDVSTGDRIRIDVDVAGTGTKGGDIILVFQTP